MTKTMLKRSTLICLQGLDLREREEPEDNFNSLISYSISTSFQIPINLILYTNKLFFENSLLSVVNSHIHGNLH